MKILVTGGAGFIGSHVSDVLVSDGHDVHILDDYSSGRPDNVPSGAVMHEHDVRSAEAATLMAHERFEILVHHAAQMDVRRSVADPGFDAAVNVLGFLNLMESGVRAGLRHIVFASTGGAIYGEPEYTPQDEAHPIRPLSPYGITKFTTENYLFFYCKEYDVSYVSLRYANVYGPRQNPHGEAGVVAIFTTRFLAGDQPFINGDGLQTRDYVYVDDVVQANRAAVAYSGSGTFNIGTSEETSVLELFRMLRDLTSSSVPEKHAEAKPGEQRRSVLGHRLAEQELGWRPRTSLDRGLEATVEWFRSHRGT